jgi:hypothetical protein
MKWSDEIDGTGATALYGKVGLYFVFHKDTPPKVAGLADPDPITAPGKPWCWVVGKKSERGEYVVLDAGNGATREKAISGAEAHQKASAYEAQEAIKLARRLLENGADEAKHKKLQKRLDDLLAAHPEYAEDFGEPGLS